MPTPPATDLGSLMKYIGERYTFTEEHYPGFSKLSTSEKLTFIVRHSQLHLSKSTGKIAAEAETADHGGIMDQENLRIATTKMLVNVLKLAEELGMTPAGLAAKIPDVMRSK